MRSRAIGPSDHSYAHAFEVENTSRLLFISGQVPEDKDGCVPEAFVDQARVVWGNIEAQLADAGMDFSNLVKVTTFLADRQYRQENFEVRHEMLAGRNIAVTIIITGIYDVAWLLEIEAIAAA